MSLLSHANNILRETGYPDVTTVVGNSNQAVRALLAQMQSQGKQMGRMGWRILTKRQTFTTVASAESYALPSDFYSFVTDTQWNTTAKDPMFGPISDQDWQANKSGVVTTDINDRFQIRADGNTNRYYIDPIPVSAENVSFFYITDTWCRAAGGQRQNEWKVDTDVLLLDSHVYELGVKWRFLRAQKRDFMDEKIEYLTQLNAARAHDGGMGTLNLATPDNIPFVANVGETDFGS